MGGSHGDAVAAGHPIGERGGELGEASDRLVAVQCGIGAGAGEAFRNRGGRGVADDALSEGNRVRVGPQEIGEHRNDGALDDLEAVGSAHCRSKARERAGRERECAGGAARLAGTEPPRGFRKDRAAARARGFRGRGGGRGRGAPWERRGGARRGRERGELCVWALGREAATEPPRRARKPTRRREGVAGTKAITRNLGLART